LADSPESHYIIDADALIDYRDSDLRVLSLFSTQIQPIHIGYSAFRKVEAISEIDAKRLHLLIEIPDLITMLTAAQKKSPSSYDDRETLMLAKQHNWSCITNDKALRMEFTKEGLKTLWGLEPMKILVNKKLIPAARAIKTARLIQQNNPAFITREILTKFEKEITKKITY